MSTETSLEQVLYNSDYWKGLSNPEKSSLAFPYGGSEEEKKKWLEENNILETPEISSDVDTVDDFDAAFEASLDPDAEEVVIEEGTNYGEGLGSRIGAKKIWTYFKDNGQVTQDFETWYKKLKENPAAQNK